MNITKNTIYKLISKEKLKVEPFFDECIKEHGLELRIGYEYAKMKKNTDKDTIDLCYDYIAQFYEIYNAKETENCIIVEPKSFVLLTTYEYIELPQDIFGICCIKSSLARVGLIIPPTVVDAGFKGRLVIEVFNTTDYKIKLRAKIPFLYLILFKTDKKVKYQGQYQNQEGIKLPRFICPK